MATKLTDLIIKEVSLVDEGANPGAHILLFKSRKNANDILDLKDSVSQGQLKGDSIMSKELEELLKKLNTAVEKMGEDNTQKYDELSKRIDDLTKGKTDDADLEKEKGKKDKDKQLDDGDGDLDPLKDKDKTAKSKDGPDANSEIAKQFQVMRDELEKQFAKREEALEKRNTELEKRLQDSEDKREMAELEKRVEAELPFVPGNATEKAKFLKMVESLPEDDQKYAKQLLQSSNEALEDQMTEKGHSKSASSNPEIALEKMAEDFMSKDATLTKQKAVTKALNTPEGAKLYEKAEQLKRRA